MILNSILVLIAVFALWVTLKWKRVKNYWAERGVTHLPPNPIVGSLTFVQRDNPTPWLRKMYKQFSRTPYIGIWLFWRPAVLVHSPDLARKVLVKDSEFFRDRFSSSGKSDPSGSLNLLTINDPKWTWLRKRLTSLFTGSKLRNIQELVRERSQDLVDRIAKEQLKNGQMDLRSILTDYTTDVIGEAALGVQSETTKTGQGIVRRITNEFATFTLYRGFGWTSIFFFPELVDIFRFKFVPTSSIKILTHLFRSIAEQRGGYDKEIKEGKDLMDALLKMRQENQEISEEMLVAQAMIMLFGGFDTTAITLSWSTYELAWNPDCQEKLYQELVEAKKNNDNKPLDATTLSQLNYLNAVISETLRKFPTMGWIDRISSQDYEIDEKLTIPAGTVVFVNAAGMHLDPEYYPDPLAFKPERFLPENERNLVPYTYLPFGEGPRICIGKRFAQQSIRFALSALLLNYELKVVPGSPKPSDVQVEKRGILMGPDEKIHVNFVPRKTAAC